MDARNYGYDLEPAQSLFSMGPISLIVGTLLLAGIIYVFYRL